MGRFMDLTGKTFNSWHILSLHPERDKWNSALWLCECVCGTRKLVLGHNLVRGRSKSCRRCLYFTELRNLTFGYWTVLDQPPEPGSSREASWFCECICGTVKLVRGHALRSGASKSCGCKSAYLTRKTTKEKNEKEIYDPFDYFFRAYKRQAIRAGHTFALTKQQTRTLITSNCHYCGIEPSQKYIIYRFNVYVAYNGIDRVDNNKEYTSNNVVPCCGPCNNAKGTRSYEDYLDWIARSARHIYIQNKETAGK